MTAGERLAFLSGLSGVSAAEHLKKLAGTIGLAGALLVMASGLPGGTAEELLLAEKVAAPTPVAVTYSSGSGGGYGAVVSGGRRGIAGYSGRSSVDVVLNTNNVPTEREDYVLGLLNTAKILITSGVLECL